MSIGKQSAAVFAAVLAAGAFVPAAASAGAAASATSAARGFDFNGDGFADLAVGVPGEDIGTATDAGALNVLYGSSTRVRTAGDWLLSQSSSGVGGAAEADDRFGAASASGDFNRDGYADLAIGVPGEASGALAAAGAVNVLYGSAGGLTTVGDQLWTQTGALPGTAEAGDAFGSSLAVGDFDKDGYADLAIGVPGEDVGDVRDAGVVHVVRGSATGLTSTGTTAWGQDTAGILDEAAYVGVACGDDGCDGHFGEEFGAALAAGDVDGDGYSDLAVGSPGESHEPTRDKHDAGAVHLIRGSAGGLTAAGNQFWHQDSPGVLDQPESDLSSDFDICCGDRFGSALAIGDFNDDGRGDLAIGVPREKLQTEGAPCEEGPCPHGAVNVLYGATGGLTATGDDFWRARDFPADVFESHPMLGTALAAGDVNGDGVTDLAIGAPGHDVSASAYEAGAVEVLKGVAGSGLTRTGRQVWTQSSLGVGGSSEVRDGFGSDIRIGQYSGSRIRDLVIATPGEDVGAAADAGRVTVLRGSTSGITATGDQVLDQDTPGVAGAAETSDAFGRLQNDVSRRY